MAFVVNDEAQFQAMLRGGSPGTQTPRTQPESAGSTAMSSPAMSKNPSFVVPGSRRVSEAASPLSTDRFMSMESSGRGLDTPGRGSEHNSVPVSPSPPFVGTPVAPAAVTAIPMPPPAAVVMVPADPNTAASTPSPPPGTSLSDAIASHRRRHIIVNYVPSRVTDEEFRELFAQFGEVEDGRIIKDRASGAPKGYGFVTFQTPAAAERAVAAMNGFEIHEKRLKVSFARTQQGQEGARHAIGMQASLPLMPMAVPLQPPMVQLQPVPMALPGMVPPPGMQYPAVGAPFGAMPAPMPAPMAPGYAPMAMPAWRCRGHAQCA